MYYGIAEACAGGFPSNSAIVCGNWVAQIRQIFQGLSPSARAWFSAVEQAADSGYSRWLVADLLGRLAVDPGTVFANFDVAEEDCSGSQAVIDCFYLVSNSLYLPTRWE